MRWKFILILTALKICHDRSFPQSYDGYMTIPASEKYSSPSFIEQIFFGSNYRKEWETPVRMPVFDIRKTNFRIVKMGGGQQTTSLELVDEQNREWVLRSVDKNVQPQTKFTSIGFIKAIIQDHVSGSYPYAGLSTQVIAKAAGVPTGAQCLYFIPDDSAFREHRSAMANKAFILVNNQPQEQKGISTDEMIEKLKSGRRYYVDQKEFLKARLVDWLIADWDRHDDQWRWIEKETNDGVALYVVPRDRDQAFYKSNGLLAGFVSLFFMPYLNKFNKNARGIKGLSKKTWKLDRQFTGQLKKEDWEAVIKEFTKNISDEVIEKAIKRQPSEIFTIRGNELIEKLKSRRDGLIKHAIKYYYFLKRS